MMKLAGLILVQPNFLVPIKASTNQGEAIVSVEDNGPGLPASVANRLFEPFTTSGKENGTGIGLYISKQIITSHAGKISCHPSKQGGTCFEIRLPLSAQPSSTAA